MDFQNSYILIFNKKINSKKFVKLFSFTIFIIIFLSFILNRLNLPINSNNLILNYQLEKINSKEFKKIKTIIIGDSSAGNGIDAKYFSLLSGINTSNLSLTGSWGIVGSTGILKNAIEKNSNIKNVIIMHTLDIWDRPFAKESVLRLFSIKEIKDILGIENYLAFLFNPKEIKWTFYYLTDLIFSRKKLDIVDLNYDYLMQDNKKYSNNKRFYKNQDLNNITVSNDKLKELRLLEKECITNDLNCIFVNGPMHKDVIKNSNKLKEYIKNKLPEKFQNIKYYNDILYFENYKMGDSLDHIDPSFKKESTLKYYNLLKMKIYK
ncbi:hypothetical protein CPG38_05075 [Malaciobacter marinus]|uniref:hypothetical protein n=1 Tax=Malaciobacter marinus TaxID=505249 RepID=UPI000C074E42|nr:hypothetical protein [Malaciobacter marinus]PHO12866.1 hypothetical protein CPG38_05075 [Malaciobacter marinus]